MNNTATYPQSLPHGYRLQGKENEYIIDHTLGQGAFGITYLAKYKAQVSGQMGSGAAWVQVCIKEFFMRELSSREEQTGSLHEATGNSLVSRYRKAFLREANNLARMQHPNIVNVFEVIEANNTAYIVMEYIDGGNLDDYIARKGHLSEDEALRLFQPICDAMNYMHAQRMLHLDLKPKNVMLDEEGKPYLIDFGLSKQYTQDGEPESSTSIGLGTPGYAPSEQAEQRDGDNSFRATIDVYALGGTLYKMLTGETPPKATEISEAVLDGTNLILEKLRKAGVSQQTSFIISKAMYPSSRKRYQSVTELMEALGWGQGKTNEETSYIRKESLNNSIHSTLQDEETRIIHQQSVLPKQPSTTQKPTGSQAMPSPQEWERTVKKTKRASTFLVIGLCIIILLGIIRICEISHAPVQTKPVSTQPAKTATNASSTQRSTPSAASTITEVKYGSLMVTSEPSGATIYLNGKPTDKTTPDVLEKLTPGNQIIHLTLNDYEPQTKSVTIKEGSNPSLKMTLKANSTSQPIRQQTTQQVTQQQTQQTNQQPMKTEPEAKKKMIEDAVITNEKVVDLGLSVLWAGWNIGASSPEGYGGLYRYGDPYKKISSWDEEACPNYDIVNTNKDIAKARWGDGWRMPKMSELLELANRCTFVRMKYKGVNGYKVVGPNGKSIFMPSAGTMYNYGRSQAGEFGNYLSGELSKDNSTEARSLFIDGPNPGEMNYSRGAGYSVRAVRDK